MSIQLIQQYYAKVDQIIRYGGARNEKQLRKPFENLLDQYARSKNLIVVPEVEFFTKRGHKVYPDGTLKDALRQDWGYWESKDEKDVLADEIATKFARGYPSFNILFEDTHTAVLYQGGEEVMRADFTNASALNEILTLFVSYERPEVREFHKAIEQFSADVPSLAKTLREIIDEQYASSEKFITALHEFLELCHKAINPKLEMADAREMIIQHILTEDIFMRVFDEAEFHRDNIIAQKLQEVAATFYTGATKRNIDARIAPYYETINARAAQISDNHEKQKFLKALYEKFYKSYNPKAADRLGVIYTPDEIVRFMIEGTDHLIFKYFDKTLGDPYVEILDPATGTGTFITELIEYLPPGQLEHKYENEIHCNEVAILPYYIANLNIEFTYKQKTGKYKEFENICFVDTLDNMGFTKTAGQMDFFGLFDANAERIGRQNTRKISVVIGNPPYNANQMNENENNKNREYPAIDQRIKETYIKYSTAQKTKLYDMYTRFLRWSSDRLSENGIIAFVSNNSFLNARSYDGFRKVISDEFNEIYIIDLKGDARNSGEKRQKEGGNIFNNQIRVGIAIYFLVRKKGVKGCQIHYNSVADYARSEEKTSYLRENKFENLKFQPIHPDKNYNWLNLAESDWSEFIPLASKEIKLGTGHERQQAIFKLFSLGVITARDEWVYSDNQQTLESKVNFLIDAYNSDVRKLYGKVTRNEVSNNIDYTIKWTRAVKNDLTKGVKYQFEPNNIIDAFYRPFVKKKLYFNRNLNEMQYQMPIIFPDNASNNIIIAINVGPTAFNVLASNRLVDYHFNGDAQCFPLFRLGEDGKFIENITDWAIGQFHKYYKNKNITKDNIFQYVYAILNHPEYRTKYEQNLKREFPHIPFYTNFWLWAGWGKSLLDLHLNYETAAPFSLQREDKNPETIRKALVPRLIARKETGVIEVDTLTNLRGVPAEAWEYRLGTYSALEWILERYKEKTPKDPTIREKFNTYKFADYKEEVIDLLKRVCTVSVETMKIIKEMPKEI